ncbi:MnhB domain-containing protein [Stieleria varia]|uniref:Na(+)/H(+) antiporter subunit B n=1 Tax=Stieleria varia TaxID=2528005 RepID=A0A5C6B2W3_9BACT|nr:MnhB domain-containing protein [Stieleria varia]TWU06157.1 Na(+)/H(+) antiporter subunit B [Stieleria varia]
MIQAHDSVIVRKMSRVLIPLIQLYALYVLFFGQQGPGGGFVCGVMLGTSLILGILVFGPDSQPYRLAQKAMHGDGVGLLIFAGIGGLCLIGGGQYLNYSGLTIPGIDTDVERHYLGILLTQVGVAIDIAVTAISIVFSLAFIDDDRDDP